MRLLASEAASSPPDAAPMNGDGPVSRITIPLPMLLDLDTQEPPHSTLGESGLARGGDRAARVT